jgi:hypothetical protein
MGNCCLYIQADKTAAVNPMKELRIEKLVISESEQSRRDRRGNADLNPLSFHSTTLHHSRLSSTSFYALRPHQTSRSENPVID